MKTFKAFTLALLTMAFVASAFAQSPITIRIVASNGDRGATQTAISKVLNSGWKFQGIGGTATSANLSVATGANFGAWNGSIGTSPNVIPLIIKVSYSGALAGIAAIAGDTDQRFVVVDGSGTTTPPNPLTGTTLGVDYEIGKADFAFSTNFQSTSPFNGNYKGHFYNAVKEDIVGVSPLGFYASPGFPGTNITTALGQQLYTKGYLNVALFTGNFAADGNKIVFALGRNTDAGQRFGALTELGLGTTTNVKHYEHLTYSPAQKTAGGITYGGTVTSQQRWHAETVSDIDSVIGNSGYSSGQLIAQAITAKPSADVATGKYYDEDAEAFLYETGWATGGGYYIGYATPNDGTSRILAVPSTTTDPDPSNNGPGTLLTYNGAALTTANIQNGSYTAWIYNRIIRPLGGVNGKLPGQGDTKADFAETLRLQILGTDATVGGGIKDDPATFKVKRTVDGGFVTPRS